uniref:NADH-ubiquinone oxidoreductase chain 2 n=1 Tax=Sphaeridium bipustulatum TaxID=290649 RepID=A0A0S2M8L4_9COLE|nr:NADH dehydrogenase subunit 2 [Sphaeridium bipustulatum]ALO70936.1 NADH deshydrogenase subunit 2 [Sphaeridium bipustulatum]
MLFFSTLISSTLITISSQSWLGMWIGLEINLLSFIPLINSAKNKMFTEASIKYFVIQALASSTVLMSIVVVPSLSAILGDEFITMIMNSALFMKMGAAPFHFWFPEVIEGLSWLNALILLTWQKIAPMVILSYNLSLNLTVGVIIACMMISGFMGINQISLRKIMAYSSINHLGWMVSSMLYDQTIWVIYFIIYSLMSVNIILVLNKFNLFYLKQLFYHMKTNKSMKLFFIMNFMSLGGLPPFIGFFPKWITIHALVTNSAYLLAFLMIVLTLFTLFFYIRITFSSILLSSAELSFVNQMSSYSHLVVLSNFISIMGMLGCVMIFNLT